MADKHFAWNRACQVCGTLNLSVLYENQLAVIDGRDMSYSVTTCSHCGFHYANQLPKASSYQSYYRSLSKYDVTLSASSIPEIDNYRAEKVISFIQPYISLDKKIFDLGCGHGTLLNWFSVSGWSNIYGIDPAPNATEQATQLYGLSCITTGSLENAVSLNQLIEADLICLMGVLEHLPNLYDDLTLLLNSVKEDASILIEVPACERFTRGDFEPYGEFSLEHIQFFSASSLDRLMENFGFYPITSHILDLPPGTTDSLLSLYSRKQKTDNVIATDTALDEYMAESESKLQLGLSKIKSLVRQPVIIYGAGSHTARLLPYLDDCQVSQHIVGIVDGNTNLQGKQMGKWVIDVPEILINRCPDIPVLVSSYRSQNAINHVLSDIYPNPIITMYQL